MQINEVHPTMSHKLFYKRRLKQRVHAEGLYLYEIPKQTKLIYVATSQDKGYCWKGVAWKRAQGKGYWDTDT